MFSFTCIRKVHRNKLLKWISWNKILNEIIYWDYWFKWHGHIKTIEKIVHGSGNSVYVKMYRSSMAADGHYKSKDYANKQNVCKHRPLGKMKIYTYENFHFNL